MELSVTCTVKFEVPGAAGVPLILPAALSVRGAGSEPTVTAHVYPPVPPLAAKVCEYAVPAVPPGNDAVVTAGAGLIVMLSAFVALEPPLAAFTVKFAVAATVGVPLITPPVDRLSPPGNAPALIVHV